MKKVALIAIGILVWSSSLLQAQEFKLKGQRNKNFENGRAEQC